jgi:hypothetical protein
MAHVLSFHDIVAQTGGRLGRFDITCPLCSAARSTPAHRKAKVFRVWKAAPDFLTYHCIHCGEKGYLRSEDSTPIDLAQVARLKAEATRRNNADNAKRSSKALRMWRASRLLKGTIGETYLRKARRISCELPATLRFLPPLHSGFHPALIAAYGMPSPDIEAGRIQAVQLTLLAPDGLSKAKNDGGLSKISIGPALGLPIVIPADGDCLTLGIAEGLEKALKIHEATGFEMWVSTGAKKLPALADAIPSCFETVIIFGDDDDDGRTSAYALASAIYKRHEIKIAFPARRAA